MSLGNAESQLNLQQQQQHPLLRVASGAGDVQTQRMPYYPQYQPNHYYPSHYHHAQLGQMMHMGQLGHQGQVGRPALVAASSNHNGAYAATSDSSGHSGYGGIEPSVEYELQPESQSYHSSGGSGPAYPSGPQHHHPPQHHGPPPAPKTTKSSKKSKKSSKSVMNALTLLAFFFFVNMLQNCLKDHMADMNPTVMVLTAGGTRNRFNKLAEMNSRERTSTMATAESVAESSWQQPDPEPALVPATPGPPNLPPVPIVTPSVVLQSSPYSGGTTHHANSHPHDYRPHIENDDYNYGQHRPATPPPAGPAHSAADSYPYSYPNRTHIDHSARPDFEADSRPGSDYYQHHYYPDRNEQEFPRYGHGNGYGYGGGSRHPWSYGTNAGRQRYSSAPWSSASLGAQSGVSSYLDNAQRRQGGHDDQGYGYRDRDRDRDRDSHRDIERYMESNMQRDMERDMDDDGQQSRRGDAFYTRARIN
ncbi:hypothetical protein KR018_010666 [Drosophila ironensis]|nr:hypothetical protein KR018_010666 [Drosophila ironensis]